MTNEDQDLMTEQQHAAIREAQVCVDAAQALLEKADSIFSTVTWEWRQHGGDNCARKIAERCSRLTHEISCEMMVLLGFHDAEWDTDMGKALVSAKDRFKSIGYAACHIQGETAMRISEEARIGAELIEKLEKAK